MFSIHDDISEASEAIVNRTEIKAFSLQASCPVDGCDGEMSYGYGTKKIRGDWFKKHRCRKCGLIQYYSKEYPCFEHEDI